MKKRIISFILCVAMCCVIFPASAFAAGAEPKHEENLTPELVAASEREFSVLSLGTYKQGKYFGYLTQCFTTGFQGEKASTYQRDAIVLVAKSQIGYHESNSSTELSGESTNGTGNYTEYGYAVGTNGAAWGGYFVNWCARQVGFNQNFMWTTPKAFDKNSVQKGDIVSMRNGQNLGIVLEVSGSYITIVEGNYSDKVTSRTYLLTSSDLTGYISPNYGTWVPQLLYY